MQCVSTCTGWMRTCPRTSAVHALRGRRRRCGVAIVLLLVALATVQLYGVARDSFLHTLPVGHRMGINARAGIAALPFGVELEFAGLGDMHAQHVNNVPEANHETVLSLVSAVFGVRDPLVRHSVLPFPDPRQPQNVRMIRTSAWTDPLRRDWKVTSESVTVAGVYDGYEVIFPAMTDYDELQRVGAALSEAPFLGKGEKSGLHVHVDGSCLVEGDPSRTSTGADGLVHLLLLHAALEPLIRRLFGTRHYGGSLNPYSHPIGSVHPQLMDDVRNMLQLRGNEGVTVGDVLAVFLRHLDKELDVLNIPRDGNASPAVLVTVADDGDSGSSGAVDRFHPRRRVFKYYSLNLSNLIPLNSAFRVGRPTVEFRAFDLLAPDQVVLAAKLADAVVAAACSPTAHELRRDIDMMFAKGGASRYVPADGEMAVLGLVEDADAIRVLAADVISTLGLAEDEFRPLLDAIKAERASDWAEPIVR